MRKKTKKTKFKIDPNCEPETRDFMNAVLDKLVDVNEACDMGSMYMLMVSYNVYVQAGKALLKEGSIVKVHGQNKVNPVTSLHRAYWSQVLSLMTDMGLTIRSRERIKSLNPPVDPNNQLMQYLTTK